MNHINNPALEEYRRQWELTKLDKKLSLEDSAVSELQEYFGYKKEEIAYRFAVSEKALRDEWNNLFKNQPIEEKSVIEFYDKTHNEIFELMHWHYCRILDGPLQYVFALNIAQRKGYQHYMDFGSGIGTGGILFALNNFKVTLADISSTNLDFCKYRFRKRGINSKFIRLTSHEDNIESNKYDMITCFDVLEHAYNPLAILKKLKNALTDDGLLIINTPFAKDENRPMHIVNDIAIINRIRSLGFSYDWDLIKECRKKIDRPVFILERKNRNFLLNTLYFIYDSMPLSLKRKLSYIYKKYKNA